MEDNPGDVLLTQISLEESKLRNHLYGRHGWRRGHGLSSRAGASTRMPPVPISYSSTSTCPRRTDARCWPRSRPTRELRRIPVAVLTISHRRARRRRRLRPSRQLLHHQAARHGPVQEDRRVHRGLLVQHRHACRPKPTVLRARRRRSGRRDFEVRILLIEDNPGDVRLLEEYLGRGRAASRSS